MTQDINSADKTNYVTQDKNSYSTAYGQNDYYAKYYGEWLFLMDISVKTALDMIKQKNESEIKELIDLSYAEIENIVRDYSIAPDDVLSCEIKAAGRIEEREAEFFDLIKKGYSINETAEQLMVSQNVVKTNIKKILAKILLYLYPKLKS